jgi:hypothetical protein
MCTYLSTNWLQENDATHPSYLSGANGHTKSQGTVLPNSMKKGKNLERLITATSQARI